MMIIHGRIGIVTAFVRTKFRCAAESTANAPPAEGDARQ